jgi:hypothetical protein
MNKEPALVVCETLRREAEAALAGTEFHDVPIFAFAARCEGGVEVAASVQRQAELGGLALHVLGANCVAQLERRSAAGEAGCKVHRTEQCFYLVARESLVDALEQDGAYLITPGWLTRWKERLDRQGLGGPEGRALFHEGIDKLVLLDTGLYPRSREELRVMGEQLDLPPVALPIGPGHLRERLRGVLAPLGGAVPALQQLWPEKAHAEYAMAMELLGDLFAFATAEEVLRRSAEVCALLLSPRSSACWLADGEELRLVAVQPPDAAPSGRPPLPPGSSGIVFAQGVAVPVRYDGELLGLLAAEEVLLPARLGDYLKVTRFIAGVAGDALHNLRVAANRAVAPGEEFTTICSYCKDVRVEEDRWQRIEEYLVPRLPQLFSHGICPHCFKEHFGEEGDDGAGSCG